MSWEQAHGWDPVREGEEQNEWGHHGRSCGVLMTIGLSFYAEGPGKPLQGAGQRGDTICQLLGALWRVDCGRVRRKVGAVCRHPGEGIWGFGAGDSTDAS